MTSKAVTETFSYDCPDKYYSKTHSDKYLSITYSKPIIVSTQDGLKESYLPRIVEIFGSQGKLLDIEPEYENFRVTGFIDGEKDYYIFSRGIFETYEVGIYEVGIYDMKGNIVKPLNCRSYVYSSPQGNFFYYSSFGSDIVIFNENCDKLFKIPTGGRLYKANAASDSTLLFFGRGSLAFWNIKTQKIIWESDIPSGLKGYVDESSHIQFSIPGNIILLRNTHGYYCFNFQGDFLWADEDYGVRNKYLLSMGVSKNSGGVVIFYKKHNISHSLFAKIFNNEGMLFEEHEIELGENVTAGRGGSLMAFSDYIFIPVSARTADQDREWATCILYKENQSWNSAVVSGFWYFLNKGSQTERLIGYDPRSKQVKGYEIK